MDRSSTPPSANKSANTFTTGEYSFRSKYCAIEGLLLAGDAYGFIDPCFSSGVLFALKSGIKSAEITHEALLANDFSPGRVTPSTPR